MKRTSSSAGWLCCAALVLFCCAARAQLPDRPISPAERQFWAFQQPRRVETPAASAAGWEQNAIDAFLLAAMKAKEVRPAPPAGRRVLIRRAYLDVLGLPPSPDQVEAFL
ncbi:MAG TPA: DUF1549 domain-containing protein, partial [Pirellulaceae bacterium]|nr:DUF1549 domain-containing protein [Pirellulaceae bacterium]